jgi:hypothetical protein
VSLPNTRSEDSGESTDRQRGPDPSLALHVTYAFLAFINLRVKLWLTPDWFNGKLEHIHDKLVHFQYVNNEQSRLLQFSIPEAIHRLFGLAIVDAYVVQRWLFVLLSFSVFHCYLRRWFDRRVAFAGVLFLSAIMPLTYFGDLQESSSLLSLTFVTALYAIREDRPWLLMGALFVGGLNNETMVVVPVIYLLARFSDWKLRSLARLAVKTIGVSVPVVAAVGLMRYFTWGYPRLAPFYQLTANLTAIGGQWNSPPWRYHEAQFLYPVLLFGAFWIYAFINYRDQPVFLRRAALVVPVYVAGHFVAGMVNEARLFLPLAFIIVPMGLWFLFGGRESGREHDQGRRR